ncbi:hypothetical protein [Ruminiclostridium cellobioparum]|uniref:hypothetical protein n=1 Tax=Ruminiclostridium cellobioparum TaxID=29355 RepID=UPI000481860D|nr:hypothetical protein [Ruminiclostridium cellobioparum]
MDNNSFSELKNKLAALPVLQERMESLSRRLYDAEDDVRSLLHKYQSEALDVDELQKDKFSHTLLKLIRLYEGKVNKETQEMLSAKLEYDKAAERVKQLAQEKAELAKKISELAADKKLFDTEYIQRENLIKSKISQQAFSSYTELERQQFELTKQIAETDEALHAASRVISAAANAVNHLKSAEGWATYDVWGGGGILSHMAKYDHIDDAKAELNRLGSLMKDFESELRDVNMYDVCAYAGIDSTTRAVDFWFDNIFTDLNVRDKIRDDMYQIQKLMGQIDQICNKLKSNKEQIKKMLSEAESKKSRLVMDFEV